MADDPRINRRREVMMFTNDFSSRVRGLFSLLVVLLFAVPAIMMIFPYKVTPADATTGVFSAERAMPHLQEIAREPHPKGSAAQERVRDYLAAQLKGYGLEVEIQQSGIVYNVVGRLRGEDSTGSIVILSHYDSSYSSPGAGDNGSGTAALVEIARALANGPALRNDLIILFDDGEEGPYAFEGTRAFVNGHPWMEDVKVAISLDTAVAGPISTNEVGPEENGRLVQVLARAYSGGAWTSFSGGGEYDSTPFKEAGRLVLALEANYPFRQQHTEDDTVEIVRPSSVQQMGEQTLAIARELGRLDLADIRDEQETFFPVPPYVLVHYPQSWALPLAIVASVLLVVAFILALRRRLSTWKGMAIAFVGILALAALVTIKMIFLKPLLPKMFGWQTLYWPEWPEVVPPGGGWVTGGIYFIVFALTIALYVLLRRKAARADISLAGLIPFCLVAILLGVAQPKTSYAFMWPVMLGAAGWITASLLRKKPGSWLEDAAAVLPAAALSVLLLPFLPGMVMSDGMKSLEILVAIEVMLLGVILPSLDGLLARKSSKL